MKTKRLFSNPEKNSYNKFTRVSESLSIFVNNKTCGSHVNVVKNRTCGSHVPTVLSILLLSFNFYLLSSQIPQGFNYQAIARDGSGNPIANATIKVKLSILSDTTGFYASGTGTYVWEEEQTGVKTNAFGLFTVVLGKGTQVGGSAASFSAINWAKTQLFIGTKIANPDTYKNLGTAPLQSVPYAMVTQSASGLKSLSVRGETALMDSALFEVKNNQGKTVFAVYNAGIRASVAPGDAKGTKGGFAIGGFDIGKAPGQSYFKVYPDSTRVYVKNPAKGTTKGGFAIGGFDGAKGIITGNFLDLTPKNYFIGHETGTKIPLTGGGLYNSVIGYKAARNITSGSYNTVLGYMADSSLNTGNNNIIIGATAGFKLTTGNHNTLIGSSAGFNHTNQEYNVMIGTSSGSNVNASGWNGSFNTFMGINSGYQIRNSKENVFLGTNAGYWLDNGWGNTFIGIDAGRSRNESAEPWPYRPSVTADYNTLVGDKAGYYITNGDKNLAIGYMAGFNNADGNGNVFVGNMAGYNETGNDKLYIANSSSNPPLIYGDFSSGSLGIGTTTLTKKLNVSGDVGVTGDVSAGSVNGMAIGKIYITATGNIIQTFGTYYTLYWIKATGEVYIYNYSTTEKCEYWYRTSAGSSSSGSLAAGGTASTFISGIGFSDGVGVEVHFGSAHGQQGWCSVWLQYANGSLVGHYMKY